MLTLFYSTYFPLVQVVGSSIGDDEPLMSAGLDSLGSVEFSNVLSQKLGMQMSGTLVFDYPSVNAVTEFLAAQLIKSAAAAAPAGESAGGDTALLSRDSELYSSQDELATVGHRRRHLALLAVVARPLMASAEAEAGPAGSVGDKIHRVPLQRWDLDLAEQLQNDPFTLSAQVGGICSSRSAECNGY